MNSKITPILRKAFEIELARSCPEYQRVRNWKQNGIWIYEHVGESGLRFQVRLETHHRYDAFWVSVGWTSTPDFVPSSSELVPDTAADCWIGNLARLSDVRTSAGWRDQLRWIGIAPPTIEERVSSEFSWDRRHRPKLTAEEINGAVMAQTRDAVREIVQFAIPLNRLVDESRLQRSPPTGSKTDARERRADPAKR